MRPLPAHVTAQAKALFEDTDLDNMAIAERTGVTYRTIARWRRCHRLTGGECAMPSIAKIGRPAILTREQEEVRLAIA